MNGLAKAINIAGNASNLASKLGIKPMSVSRWKTRYKGVVPAERVLSIYNATGVTPHELRPDLYPNPSDGLPLEESQQCKFSQTEMIATENQDL